MNLILLNFKTEAQKNLVPNPDFEMMNLPCSQLTGFGGAQYWHSPNYPSDVYEYTNACIYLPCCGVPYNTYGLDYQYPHSGNAYVALFYIYYTTFGSNQKDYVQTKLLDTLKKGKCYFFEFYTNKHGYYNLANNNIGLLIRVCP